MCHGADRRGDPQRQFPLLEKVAANGGPVVTDGGLVFVAATKDEMFRAFDAKTGRVLWQAKLPAGGYATPATYESGGRQYVVVAAGGGKMGTKSGDAYVAFALPR